MLLDGEKWQRMAKGKAKLFELGLSLVKMERVKGIEPS